MNALVARLKEDEVDFEWYPTTDSIISVIKSKCKSQYTSSRDDGTITCSVLDCGAGDGRVLMALTAGKRFAIEKAVPLIQAMDCEIILVGTEFFQSTLIDKPVDVVFCNPPYSEFEQWAVKVILEAHAGKIFLVIPTRWKKSPDIEAALKRREVEAEVLGTFDFLNAERAARAEVDILHIVLKKQDRYSRYDEKSDPFDLWFDTEFDFKKAAPDRKLDDDEEDLSGTLKDKLHKAVIGGKGKVPALVELYGFEMAHLYENFKQISALDADLLKELGTSKGSIREALKQRITGLKNKYWKELFDSLDDITSRLTSKSRGKMLDKLTSQTNVDFTETNIYGVLIWVIKNANWYFDRQLIEMVEEMVTEANIVNYKSNAKVYKFDNWRYSQKKKNASHFGLELRIVLYRHSAIVHCESYDRWNSRNGLHDDAHNFLNDIITIAKNLNIEMPSWTDSRNASMGQWTSGKSKDFYINGKGVNGKSNILMSVRAFMNGNLHIKFNQKFIRRLNVEFGRLKGWLNDAQQAADEMDIPVEEAAEAFRCNKLIEASTFNYLQIEAPKEVVSHVTPETKKPEMKKARIVK